MRRNNGSAWTVPPELTYRDDFSGPRDRAEVYRLLQDVFGLDVSPLEDMALWDPSYRAFSYQDYAGCCVANAATFTLPLIVNGRSVAAMGVQSVATRPSWRRRGLSHDLLRRALRWCDANARITFLMTSIPGFYEPMGFTIVPQFAYAGDAPAALPPAQRCRRLDLAAGADRQLLARLLRRRAPVSTRFAVSGLPGAFALNLLDQTEFTAWHMAARDAVVVTAERSDGTLCIVDVSAPTIPELAEMVAALGVRPGRVEVHFPPDRLGWNGSAVPIEASTVLMVRGDPGRLEPFMIPETAAF
jgi:GNAT superfamily N-acetyltransferase